MKNITFGAFVWLAVSCSTSLAQSYWVIETNRHQKNFTIIKFYNAKQELIHEVKKEGVYLNISKKRQRKKLDAMLKNYQQFGSTFSKREGRRKNVAGL
jgi:hypothetical protein